MRQYGINDGWDSMHGDLIFTIATLRASGVHAPLAAPLAAHVARWEEVDAERRRAEVAVVEANAMVEWVNGQLDHHTVRFSVQLLADCDGDRTHPTYTAFFPVAPGEITRLGLESQLDAMRKFETVAATVKLSMSAEATLGQVSDAMALGRAALASRATAALGMTAVARKQAAWRDEANDLRRATDTALHDHANRNRLPRDYAAGFFPGAKAAKKSAAKAPAAPPHTFAGLSENEQVLALPDRLLRGLADEFITALPANIQAVVRARRAG